jgi:UDP-glucose 4-epimerase
MPRTNEEAALSAKVLVTGGAGFIGSNLARALLERGDDVRILDNFSTGIRDNLTGLEDDIEIVEGELRSYERVHAAVRGIELVFHQGALPSVPRSVQDPLTTSAVNVEGTLNVLLAARDEGARRVVFASSSSVYGSNGALPRCESSAPDPISPYAVSKLAAERYCAAFSSVYGLETVSLRYFNVFGPHQDPTSQYSAVVPRFVAAIEAGRPVSIYGDGTQSRDFTYVANVVQANLLAADAPDVSGAVLNVATGKSTTVDELAQAIGLVLDKTVEREYLPVRPAEVRDSWADLSEVRRRLGYEPEIVLEDGLRHTVDFFSAAAPRPLGLT